MTTLAVCCDSTAGCAGPSNRRDALMWPRPAPNRGTKPDFPAFELGSHEALEIAMSSFMRRLVFHYGIYRRYPLRPLPALKNAWRIARA